MRSKLFVPGSRPELFAKAMASAADALSFDLEDSVVEARKAEARAAVAAFLGSAIATTADKTLIVRVNPIDSPHFDADIRAVVRPGLALVNLPKVEHVDEVLQAVAAIEAAERANGFGGAGGGASAASPSTPGPIRLLLNIETPRALGRAADLALADPRVAGLQLGLGDLFEPLGIDRREPVAIGQAMFALRIAAGVAGVFACDGAFANIADADGFRAEAALARRLGFIGKSCIHPSQIALANDAFRPSDDEIAAARRVVAAARAQAARGVGAFVVDGRMIDAPFIERAERILAIADRLEPGEPR